MNGWSTKSDQDVREIHYSSIAPSEISGDFPRLRRRPLSAGPRERPAWDDSIHRSPPERRGGLRPASARKSRSSHDALRMSNGFVDLKNLPIKYWTFSNKHPYRRPSSVPTLRPGTRNISRNGDRKRLAKLNRVYGTPNSERDWRNAGKYLIPQVVNGEDENETIAAEKMPPIVCEELSFFAEGQCQATLTPQNANYAKYQQTMHNIRNLSQGNSKPQLRAANAALPVSQRTEPTKFSLHQDHTMEPRNTVPF